MIKTINTTQVVSDICDTMLLRLYENNPSKFPDGIIINLESGFKYTKEAQLVFNQLYNEFLEIINENEIE